ncbi:MAG: outer membrane protein assembly factor BamE [Nitrospirae bacterium]|nr:outer membrane protein assembly factor BamE [Nitrospirota bacterium]
MKNLLCISVICLSLLSGCVLHRKLFYSKAEMNEYNAKVMLSDQEKEREEFPSLKMNDIEIGMTKQQVIQIMGQPSSTSAINNKMYLNYNLHEWKGKEKTAYFVRFIDGKVESYGKTGDFDSTKVPESKTTVDVNIKNKDSK